MDLTLNQILSTLINQMKRIEELEAENKVLKDTLAAKEGKQNG